MNDREGYFNDKEVNKQPKKSFNYSEVPMEEFKTPLLDDNDKDKSEGDGIDSEKSNDQFLSYDPPVLKTSQANKKRLLLSSAFSEQVPENESCHAAQIKSRNSMLEKLRKEF